MKGQDRSNTKQPWCLILGGSSGLGLATARKMAEEGYGLVLVHRDRKLDLPRIQEDFEALKSLGHPVLHYNQDALQDTNREELIKRLSNSLPKGEKIRVLVHSIARGNLKPLDTGEAGLNLSDFQLTINAMALSCYTWTKSLLQANLLDEDTRVIAFTSEGNSKVWEGYGAVSAAKTALEATIRQMAVEWAPKGIKANCVQAGVTDTPSLRMIPGSEKLLDNARKRNPNKRITTPEDVANVVYLLSMQEASWITGTVIKADGGESLR